MPRINLRLFMLISIGLLVFSSPLLADEDQMGVEFFEKRIRPLLAKYCYECHGAEKQESALRLDKWRGMLDGGDTGESLFSDNPSTSLMMAVLNYELDDLQMPPDGKLAAAKIKDMQRWLEMGAPHAERKATSSPGKPAPAKARKLDHWAFQPIQQIAPPAVKDQSWVGNEIDHFIRAKQESLNLSPVAQASKSQLVRRATIDLWGLPPSPKEVADFLADNSADAYPRLLDRLLASPRYGERWGRHWLDVVRYADSNGLDENIAHGNAWRFRDYVVSSWNRDKPFDELVVEHIAGDRLVSSSLEQRHERLVATGFLAMGPKVLAESDLKKMEMDIIDEQIDTLGKTFLGLTLGCARCHDHKFDPFPGEDYYALAGVFKSTQTMEQFKRIARWHEHSLADEKAFAELAAHSDVTRGATAEVSAFLSAAVKRLPEADQKLAAKAREAKFSANDKKQLDELRAKVTTLQAHAPVLPAAMGVTEGTPTDVQVHIRGNHLSLGKVVKRRLPLALAGADQTPWPENASGRLRLARWLVSPDHPLTARVIANRVWRWHFGAPLCSADNFGLLGQRPTHPGLLDWLALRLMDEGWSIKRLHRTIMLSSVYRLGGEPNRANETADAANHTYWRFRPRRMEAEAIRDSLFYVGGQLDERMGGSLLHVKNREFFFNHLSKDTTNYVSQRRSIYLPIVRNNLYDVFSLFDYADASVMNGNRDSTTVAPQALFMLNSDIAHDASLHLAERITELTTDDASRVNHLFRILFSRTAGKAEIDDLLRFIAQTRTDLKDLRPDERELAAWKLACQICLASNEFIYIQ
jgi:cytochrome c553